MKTTPYITPILAFPLVAEWARIPLRFELLPSFSPSPSPLMALKETSGLRGLRIEPFRLRKARDRSFGSASKQLISCKCGFSQVGQHLVNTCLKTSPCFDLIHCVYP